jgi:uncharacterized protein YqjF (DUF2071 family)
MTQTWHDLLFVHWPLPPDALRPAVPAGLEIDTFNGSAWLGIVAFRLSAIRLRGLPEVPFTSHFPEINVRTYVTHGDKPGVYFMSLDADNRLAIALAKPWFRLAYHLSRIRYEECAEGIRFHSRRLERNSPGADFTATYGPCGPVFKARPGSLEHWLTERYCYYSAGRSGKLYRCDIRHTPWQLQRAQAQITTNTMALSHGIELPGTEPSLLYARHMKALIWGVVGVEGRFKGTKGQRDKRTKGQRDKGSRVEGRE